MPDDQTVPIILLLLLKVAKDLIKAIFIEIVMLIVMLVVRRS